MTPRFYLASRYSRRDELLGVRDVIKTLGGEVTSRWLNGDHQIADGQEGNAGTHGERFAVEDMEDLESADVVVCFTEEPRATNSRGGRHVEFGMALALNKHVIVVGPRENVFTWLPQVEWHPDWSRAALSVTALAQGRKRPGANRVHVVETLVYDVDGNPEVQQVEEVSGQHRMHFVGMDD